MKRFSRLFAAPLFLTAIAGATPMPGHCAGGALSTYLGNGFSCTIGNLLFSNFSYTPGGTVQLPATSITINPLNTPVGDEGFDFNPGQGVSSSTPTLISEDVNISFLVSTVNGAASINDLFIGFNGSTTGSGLANFTEKYCPGQTTTIGGSCTGGGTFSVPTSGAAINQTITFANSSMVAIDKDVLVSTQGGIGQASVSDFANRYSQTLTPEPGTLLAMAGGLIGLGLMRRRRAR
jgi:hypothetical protein